MKRPLHEILSKHSAIVLALSAVVALWVLGLGTTLALGSTDGPKISGVEVINVAQTSATIAWITDSAGASQVNFGNAIDTLRFSVFDPALTTQHSAPLTGLTPDTRYFFQVHAVDAHDKTITQYNKGKYYSFTTLTVEGVPRAFAGLVVSGPTANVTLYEQRTGELVKIILPENYALDTPGGLRAGTFKVGVRAVILGKPVNGNWVALSVLVKPLKPATPVTGVITSIKEGVVTLISPDGTAQTLTLPSNVNKVATGDLVTAFPDASGSVRGLVKAAQLRERLTQFLVNIEASENKNLEDDFQAKHADHLIKILDQQISRQEEIIANVLRRAPEEIKGAISRTKEEIEQFTLDSHHIKARIRAKFGLEEEASSKGQGSSNSGQGSGQGSGQDNQGRGSSNSGQGSGQENQGQGSSNSGQGSGQDNQGQGSSNSGQGSGQGSGQENQGQGSSNSGQGSGQENQGQAGRQK